MSLLLYNARIHRTAFDHAPADALLVRDGHVAAIGTREDFPDIEKSLDLGGRTVLPGLTDAHLHLFMMALARFQISLAGRPVSSIPELIATLQADGGDTGWIQACDLSEDRLAEQRLPTAADLDPAFPDRPVLLRRYCGHVAVMNSAAMRALGLSADTPEPPAGSFLRGAASQLTGVAKEAAAEQIFARAPIPSTDKLATTLREVMEECLAVGLTAVVEAAVGFSSGYDREADVWAHLRASGALPVRLGLMLQLAPEDAAQRGLTPEHGASWSSETLKFFADGIIGDRSGALTRPYEDTGETGMLMHPAGALERALADSHARGWRIAVHATGDRGIARVTAAIKAAQGADRTRRHRIEHCFVPPSGLFGTLAEHGIMVVTQPGFVWRMGGSIARALGRGRCATAYPASSVLRAGAMLTFSSDAPIGPLSPWTGMRAAITRMGPQGDAIGTQEALALPDALDAYIAGGATAMRHEEFRGALRPGMAADLVAMARCPFSTPVEALPDLRADLCMIGGRITFRSAGLAM